MTNKIHHKIDTKIHHKRPDANCAGRNRDSHTRGGLRFKAQGPDEAAVPAAIDELGLALAQGHARAQANGYLKQRPLHRLAMEESRWG